MLKELRERKGLTVTELSRLSGVSKPMIYLIEETGYRKCKKSTLYKLANVLDVDVEEITK